MIRTFDKCLKTELRAGSEKQVTYILPYTGYLTDAKYDQLSELFAKKLAGLYQLTHEDLRIRLALRLRSEWYTGREKDLLIEPDEFGTFSLKANNWFTFGYKAEDFVIVE